MPKPTSLYNHIISNNLSSKTYFLLLTTVAIAYLGDFKNKSTLLLLMASTLIGEYYSLPKVADPIQRSKKRFIGFVESAMHVQHQYAEGSSNVGSIMRVSGEIIPNEILNVLSIMSKRHPLLRARLVDSHGAPSLQLESGIPPDNIPFKIKQRTSENFSHQYLEEILDNPLYSTSSASSNYLWELTLAKNGFPNGPHELILKAHHTIFDGISVGIFMQELLAFYNKEKTVENPLPFLKPAEDLLTLQTNWTRFFLKHILSQIWGTVFGEKITYRAHTCQTKLFSDRRTKVSFSNFSENDLKRLIEVCRQHNTTLTALMTASLLQATREVLGVLDIESISTPVSIRPYCENNLSQQDPIGCYVANTEVKLHITSDMSIWEIAKKYKNALSKCIPVIYPANFNPSKWKLKIMENNMLSDQSHFKSGISVSNLGSTNFVSNQSQHASLTLLALYFCASKRLGEKTIQLYAITAGGKLNLCFAHPEPALTRNQAERIQEKTLLNLYESLKKIEEHNYIPIAMTSMA